jgi:hypothetical protein
VNAGAMPKRELPPEVSAQVDEIVERHTRLLKEDLLALFRFHGIDTIDAVCTLLDERCAAIHPDELVTLLKRGGLAMQPSTSKGGPEGDVKRSFSYYTSRNLRIRELNGLIGRVEWPDEKFVAATDASKPLHGADDVSKEGKKS